VGKNTWSLLSVVLIVVQASAFAQNTLPVSTITSATWEQYKAEYPLSPLCTHDEIPLWSCERGTRVFSLCSSRKVTRTTGYIQYRAANAGKVEMIYPSEKVPPLNFFAYSSFANGNTSIDFTNNGYVYSIFDPLRGKSSISVTPPEPAKKRVEISCQSSQTLQINYTMRLMYEAGLWQVN
jgi:hypothetical protein